MRSSVFPQYAPPQNTILHVSSNLILLLTTQVLIQLLPDDRMDNSGLGEEKRNKGKSSNISFSPLLLGTDSQTQSLNKSAQGSSQWRGQ